MWKEIVEFFDGQPAKLKVARLMVELGFCVKNVEIEGDRRRRDEKTERHMRGRVFCGDVEIPDSSIARAAGVDRRVVGETVGDIQRDQRMRIIFTGIKPAGSFLRDVAPMLGYGVVEIRARAGEVGVIAKATTYISEAGVRIRQILAEDPDLNPDPKLLIITEKRVPGEVVSELLTIPTVTKVSLS